MKQRIISSIIMIIISVPFIILGGIYFKIFAFILSGMCLYELLKYQKNIPIFISFFSYLLLGLLIFNKDIKIPLENCILIIILFYMLSSIFIKNNQKYTYKHVFLMIGIVFFLGFSFQSIINVRMRSFDELVYLLLIAISTDSFALIIGKKFGHNKLAPTISPNKTIEGFIGGLVVGTIIGTIYYLIRLNYYNNFIIIIIITCILSIMGQFGDLIKSKIKRNIGIKDFSNLIPGHGGILDRLDSLIFISIFYIILINIF